MYAYWFYWRYKKAGKLWLLLTLVLYFPAMEVMQFFIKSRFSNINDLLSGYIGSSLGIGLFFLAKKDNWRKSSKIYLNHFTWVIVIYLFLILYKGLAPFEFTAKREVWMLDLNLHNLVPFYAYFKVTSIWNIYDILETFLATIPMGLIIAVYLDPNVQESSILKRAMFAGGLIGMIIEVGQVFMQARNADITDVMNMALGALLGAYFYFYYKNNYIAVNKAVKQ